MAYFLDKSGLSVEITTVSNIEDLRDKSIDIYEMNKEDTFIVFGTDIELFELSRSNLSLDQRNYILPSRNPQGVKILGSKVGLYEHLKKFDIPHPRTEIARNFCELNQITKDFDFPFFVKADVGSGGRAVERYASAEQLQKKEE